MPRSILTEKLSRRGIHLTREYGTDPLETVSLVEVMAELGPHDCTDAAPAAGLPEVYAYSRRDLPRRGGEDGDSGLTTLLVVDRATQGVCGTVSVKDLLLGRRRADETRTGAGAGVFARGVSLAFQHLRYASLNRSSQEESPCASCTQGFRFRTGIALAACRP
jgi:hypothetical protein